MEQLKVAISLNTANKSKLEILGTSQITFTIGTQVKVARVVVARNLAHDMILGTDFLRKHKCCIEFEDDTVRVGGLSEFHEWIPILGSRQKVKSINSIDSKPGDIVNINKELTDSEKEQIKQLINEYQDVFSKGPEDIGESSFTHKIELTSDVPVKKKSYRTAEAHKKVVEEELRKMIRMEVVQKSTSPYGAPVVLIKKKDNTVRFCIDFRGLNEVTTKDNFPMPYIDEELEGFLGKRYFTTIDLTSGYWQFLVDDSAKKYTAFTTHQGSFEFNRMPFGLCNAGATFQRAMQELLEGLEYARSFIDDIIISSETFEEHLVHLRKVLEKLRKAKLKAKPSKCNIGDFETKFLGFIVTRNGIKVCPSRSDTIASYPAPKTVRQVRSFLGLASYYRKFIEGFSDIAQPMIALTAKSAKWAWGEECKQSFEKLKQCLMNPPILVYPDHTKTFYLTTDASLTGLGAVLSQAEEGEESVIAYANRTL